MQTDLYTRIVLGVIALCLVWICARDFVPAAAQAQGVQGVTIVGVARGVTLPVTGWARVNTLAGPVDGVLPVTGVGPAPGSIIGPVP
ncbi:MAG TPA: hypothetical protein VGA73_14190 [Candidatus Binatia bacterium]